MNILNNLLCVTQLVCDTYSGDLNLCPLILSAWPGSTSIGVCVCVFAHVCVHVAPEGG